MDTGIAAPFIVGAVAVMIAQERVKRATASFLIRWSGSPPQCHLVHFTSSYFLYSFPPESRDSPDEEPENSMCILDPETRKKQIIYFDPKKTSVEKKVD